MHKIRQGHTRWRLDTICGRDGLPSYVWMYRCLVTKVTWCAVHYFDGYDHRCTSHWAWMQMHKTQRKAWREAIRMTEETTRIRVAEYAEAWEE